MITECNAYHTTLPRIYELPHLRAPAIYELQPAFRSSRSSTAPPAQWPRRQDRRTALHRLPQGPGHLLHLRQGVQDRRAARPRPRRAHRRDHHRNRRSDPQLSPVRVLGPPAQRPQRAPVLRPHSFHILLNVAPSLSFKGQSSAPALVRQVRPRAAQCATVVTQDSPKSPISQRPARASAAQTARQFPMTRTLEAKAVVR